MRQAKQATQRLRWLVVLVVGVAAFLGCVLWMPSSSERELASVKQAPNVVFIMMDDVGWGNVGYNRNPQTAEVWTPNIDRLATVEGLRLNRHYVFYSCTPTRTSTLSGRLPVHVSTNLSDPEFPNTGIPKKMTAMAEKFKESTLGKYATHMVGKWDAGMATPEHTPKGRGFDSSLIYWGHMNDYWSQQAMSDPRSDSCLSDYPGLIDLWQDGKPASSLNGTQYEDLMLAERVSELLDEEAERAKKDKDNRFFLYYAPHIAHFPLQIPREKMKNDFPDDEYLCTSLKKVTYDVYGDGKMARPKCRSLYHSMVTLLDEILGDTVAHLKRNKLWDNTLIVVSSDNGGSLPIVLSASNNHPLKGGKYSPWEGGTRAVAFVTGGYLPAERRGSVVEGIMHISDWYATFAGLIGVDAHDSKAAKYKLPPVDSLDVWPMISGDSESPHKSIIIDRATMVQDRWKLLVGEDIKMSGWTGPVYPNASSARHPMQLITQNCKAGCLYDLHNDPTEHLDRSKVYPQVLQEMVAELNSAKASFYENSDVGVDACPPTVPRKECMCWMAHNYYHGYYGPFQDFSIN